MGNESDLKAKNTSCYIQVLSVGADSACTVPSALLFFDRQRYLFNVGEGFQRFCTEHHIKMAKVNGVLTTRVTTEATGGLPGMLITMADTSCGGLLSGNVGLSLQGPPGLKGTVNAFRTFVNVKDMGLRVGEFDGSLAEGSTRPRPVIKNELVTITPVVVRPEGAVAEADTAAATEPEAKRQRVDGPAEGLDVPSVATEGPAACYICELADIPGKFQPQKAASLGVPRGPAFGKLARGESVVGASGLVVKPEDVMDPSTPGPVVIVADCPAEAFVNGLVGSQGLGGVLDDAVMKPKVACVVHLTPPDVMALPAYQTWMQAFGETTQHIVAAAQGPTAGGPVLRKSATLQTKLNVLAPKLFPIADSASAAAANSSDAKNIIQGTNMIKFQLRPLVKQGINADECADEFRPENVRKSLKSEVPHVLDLAAADSDDTAASDIPAAVKNATGEELQITFLGTGAAVPSKYRNVTGILVDMPSKNNAMMMDCGEGSWGQMRRRFGSAADDILRRISLVWISHIHADHHVGLPSLLAARSRLLGNDCPPVLVIGPRPLRRALLAYAKLEPMHFRYVEASSTAARKPDDAPVPEDVAAAVKEAVEKLGLSRLESIQVVHCAHSYGLVLESNDADKWKVVFSGDTRPCDAVIDAAKDATLLIHEATFEDELADEAIAKKHSTTQDAVMAGAKSGAYRTILTHFSQRYPKVPVIDDNFVDHVGIAFDLMTVKLTDLPRLPKLVPALKALFDEEENAKGDEEEEPVPQMLS